MEIFKVISLDRTQHSGIYKWVIENMSPAYRDQVTDEHLYAIDMSGVDLPPVVKMFVDTAYALDSDIFYIRFLYEAPFKRAENLKDNGIAIGDMSSLQDRIVCTYDKLVQAFGQPNEPYDVIQASWELKIGDTYAHIYDYKNPIPPEDNTMWHIGGFSEDAVNKVKEILNVG